MYLNGLHGHNASPMGLFQTSRILEALSNVLAPPKDSYGEKYFSDRRARSATGLLHGPNGVRTADAPRPGRLRPLHQLPTASFQKITPGTSTEQPLTGLFQTYGPVLRADICRPGHRSKTSSGTSPPSFLFDTGDIFCSTTSVFKRPPRPRLTFYGTVQKEAGL